MHESKDSLHTEEQLATCFGNVANLYKDEGNYDSAFAYTTKALRIFEDLKIITQIIASRVILAELYKKTGDYNQALENYFIGLKQCEESGRKDFASIYMGDIGETYFLIYKDTSAHSKTGKNILRDKKENLAKSLEYLKKALAISKEVDDKESIKEFSQVISDVYKESGDYKQAYENYVQYTIAKDTIATQDGRKKLTLLETETAKELKDKQIKVDELEVEKKHRESYFLYIGMVVLIFIIFLVVRSNMKQNKSNKIITREKKRSDELLLNILPAEVAEELKDKGSADAQYFNEVTVFFSDFVGFTKVAERMTPQQLVNELDACFKGFDHIMTKYNIEKIKTVGDAYLAVSGLPMTDPNHAEKIIRAAIEIRDFQLDRKKKLGDMTFEVRIGAHSGSVVAGIVGVKKFAYDIWGDTVNTAARMEQNSMPGKINISEDTFNRVKDKFNCEFRGKIQAKNKGELSMYFVEPNEHDD